MDDNAYFFGYIGIAIVLYAVFCVALTFIKMHPEEKSTLVQVGVVYAAIWPATLLFGFVYVLGYGVTTFILRRLPHKRK